MDKQKRKKAKRRSLWRVVRDGLDKLPTKVGQSIPVRALCRIGCADESIRRTTEGSFFARLLARLKLKHRVVNPTKRYFASAIEDSRVLEYIFRFLNFFYTMPVLYYGIMLLAIGLTLCGLAALSAFMQGTDVLLSLAVLDFPMAITGIVILLVSLPFLLTDNQPLSSLLVNSRFGNQFLCGFLGLDPVSIRRTDTGNRRFGGLLSVAALLVGVGIGVVTRYVNASVIPITVLAVITTVIVMTAPEAGLMLIAMLIPLLNTARLAVFVLLTLASFGVKLLRGKRSLRMTMTDIAFLMLAAVIFVECVLGDSGKSAGYMAILYCMLAVMGSHLLRSNGVAMRFQRALMFSSTVAILALTVDTVLAYVPAHLIRDIPIAAFSDYVIGNFGSRSVLGMFLFLMFPFVISVFYLSSKVRTRLRYLLCLLLILASFVLLQSRTIIVGAILLLALYLLMRSPRHLITVLLGTGIGVVLLLFILPDRYMEVLSAHFVDSNTNILQGVREFGRMFVESAGRYFVGVGFEGAQGNDLYTYLLSALGLGGLLLFVLLMLLLIGYATVSTIRNRSASPKLYPAMIACYTAVFGMLFVALRMPVLDRPAILLTFVLICGFTMGISRTMRKNAVLSEAVTDTDIEFSPIFNQGGDRYE